MNRALWFSFGLLWLVGSFVHAQTNYTIDWFTIDGGGGTSTGGVYSVSATIGQPDAGAMSGGSFTVEGGFWVMAAVQKAGAPWLSIFLTSSNTVIVTWPSSSTGWILQQNTNNLSSTGWSNITAPVPNDGTNRTFIITPPTGNRFYRLWQP